MRKLEINATLIQSGDWKGFYLVQVDGIITKDQLEIIEAM